MTMKQKSIIISILLLLISAIITVIVIFIMSRPLKPEFAPAFTESDKKGSIINNYDVSLQKFDKDSAVLFKNVVASTADLEQKYFKIDVLIVTNNKESAKVLRNNHQTTVLLIANALLRFKKNEVNSIEGKAFLKKMIKQEIERKYGQGVVKGIFFENFIIS